MGKTVRRRMRRRSWRPKPGRARAQRGGAGGTTGRWRAGRRPAGFKERGVREFAQGDWLVFLKNDATLLVCNGSLGTFGKVNGGSNAGTTRQWRHGQFQYAELRTSRLRLIAVVTLTSILAGMSLPGARNFGLAAGREVTERSFKCWPAPPRQFNGTRAG